MARKTTAPDSPGARLAAELSQPGDLLAITTLVTEAARIADRLAALDARLSARHDAWMTVRRGRDGSAEVRMAPALGEARHQVTVLRHLLAAIRRQRDSASPGFDPEGDVMAGL